MHRIKHTLYFVPLSIAQCKTVIAGWYVGGSDRSLSVFHGKPKVSIKHLQDDVVFPSMEIYQHSGVDARFDLHFDIKHLADVVARLKFNVGVQTSTKVSTVLKK